VYESLGKIKCLTSLEPRMTTEAADRNAALHDIPKIQTRGWLHRECGHYQQVPISGGDVFCEGCGTGVNLAPKKPSEPKKSKRRQTTLTGVPIVLPEEYDDNDVKIYRVTPQKPLQTHFEGYNTIRMVMYVQRIDFIVDLFEKYGVTHAQIIVGDSLVKKERNRSEPEIFLKLAEYISDGKLEIRIPTKNRMFHEKWILAENDEKFADIFGTANLTTQGSGKTGKQSNQLRIRTITGQYKNSKKYLECEKQYAWYLENSEPYLDDLVELLKLDVTDDNPALEVIEKWITYTGAKTTGDTRKVQAIVQEFQEAALRDSLDPDAIVTTITTNASNAVLDEVVKILGSNGVQRSGRQLTATTRPFLQQRVSTFPIMSLIGQRLVLQVNSESTFRTAEEYDLESITNGLHGIHQYIETIDKASSKNPLVAKKSMFEVILYFLTSPMHHHFMLRGKQEFGWHYDRGPTPLAIYGNTKNGKTFLLKYCTKLLTGNKHIVQPLKDDDFTTSKIRDLLTWSSLFPIIVDDISDSKWGKQYMDQIGRNYWDNWWSNSRNHSQMIVTSNRRIPQGQLKGRMKEIVMDARFEDKTENIKAVSEILNQDNQIFQYFSKRYLEILENEPTYYNHRDCMHVGRRVMKELYEMVDLKRPSYFPECPIEDVVDGNALTWLALFNEGDALCKKTPQGELKITFTNDEDGNEVRKYMDLIPEGLDPKKSGKSIRLQVPVEFVNWLKKSLSAFEVRRKSRGLKKILRIT
jgi:hypothetical protein